MLKNGEACQTTLPKNGPLIEMLVDRLVAKRQIHPSMKDVAVDEALLSLDDFFDGGREALSSANSSKGF